MVRLVIPGPPPPGANQLLRMHWAAQANIGQEWGWLVKEAVLRERCPRFDRATVTIRLYYATNRRRDRDNATTACKVLLDALVHAGVIPDDNAGVVDLRPVEIHVDRNSPRVEIEIEEVVG